MWAKISYVVCHMVTPPADPKLEIAAEASDSAVPVQAFKAEGKFAAKKPVAEAPEASKPKMAAKPQGPAKQKSEPIRYDSVAYSNNDMAPESAPPPARKAAPEPKAAVEPEIAPPAVLPWDELGLSAELLNLVKTAGFDKPTLVQSESI
ncbi:MAG: hypothetical protein H7333_01975, partial [Bdellovibrionales bacterium]|nr:hypothetical protein [Oligoflexia bacterium]